MKILIVDDSEYKVREIKDILTKAGYTDIEVRNALNPGLHYLLRQRDTIDLILLDMQMPRYSDSNEIKPNAGERFLEEMKRIDCDIPVILISSEERDDIKVPSVVVDPFIYYEPELLETIKSVTE